MVFLIVDVNGGDDVLFGDGTGDIVALLVQPFDGFDMGLDDLFILAEVQGGDGPEAAKLLEFRLVAGLIHLNADLEITVSLKKLF